MDTLSRWVAARAYRATVINVLLLGALLAMVGSVALFQALGGAVIAIAGLCFAGSALRTTIRSRWRTDPYHLALTWLPGTLAICLGATGLALVARSGGQGLAYGIGALLFACELAVLVIARADLTDGPASSHAPTETV